MCRTRKWKNKPDRLEYYCNGYHRYGTENCTPHRINEEYLDTLIYNKLLAIKDKATENYKAIESAVKKWMKQKTNVSSKLKELNDTLEQRKADQKEILLELIRDSEHEGIYTEMLVNCEADIKRLTEEIEAIVDYNTTIKKRRAEMKTTIDLIEKIIEEGAISDANLRLLVDTIIITENNSKLSIQIRLNTNFQKHKDCYDADGNIKERVFST